MGDPNWLPSTLAQSTAALVAILGGFIISRVIAERQERGALRRRWQELEQQLEAVNARLYMLQEQRATQLGPHAGDPADRAQLERTWDELHPERQTMEWEVESLTQALTSIGERGRDRATYELAVSALRALGLLLVLGLVFPVTVLATRPSHLSDSLTVLLVLAFVGGLIAVAWTMWSVVGEIQEGFEDTDY